MVGKVSSVKVLMTVDIFNSALFKKPVKAPHFNDLFYHVYIPSIILQKLRLRGKF